ncbi:hypothetical protein [Cryptosporangium sp. NPDC051539]|uniref:hypothetical protein n=1 Tax=Cryptosporangium sp. NPDC051539 TaxID=3363962 RepID=UPI00378DBB8C
MTRDYTTSDTELHALLERAHRDQLESIVGLTDLDAGLTAVHIVATHQTTTDTAQPLLDLDAGLTEIVGEALDTTPAHSISEIADQEASTEVHPLRLTGQEREALRFYRYGLSIAAIARRLNVRTGTAQLYINRVRDKFERAGLGWDLRASLKIEEAADWSAENDT